MTGAVKEIYLCANWFCCYLSFGKMPYKIHSGASINTFQRSISDLASREWPVERKKKGGSASIKSGSEPHPWATGVMDISSRCAQSN